MEALMKKDDRYFMSSVKIGPKGQIVIPKEVRDMFGIETGDSLVLLADKTKGIAIQKYDELAPILKTMFKEENIGEENEQTDN